MAAQREPGGTLRRVGASGLIVVTAALVIVQAAFLVGSIAKASDISERAPEALIAISALGMASALGALYASVQCLRRRVGSETAAAMACVSVLLIFVYAVVSFVTGPL